MLAFSLLILLALAGLAKAAPAARQTEPPNQRFPNVVILTIDTLRADRLSSYGYRRPTSPNVDRLLASGVRFTQARTVEPLTNPALCSMFTSLYPHEHGATRNGLRLRPGLPSVAGVLQRRGYRTAAFVGNWTLKDRISGLGEHFERYDEVFSRKRWFGVFKSEATAEDLSDAALEWLDETNGSRRPFLLWVHYVEPHAPYRLQEGFARPLGIPPAGNASRSDRYDTEIAFADHHLGRVLAFFDRDPALKANTLFIFTADHGESLGEHGYWGHGRNLHEPGPAHPPGALLGREDPPGHHARRPGPEPGRGAHHPRPRRTAGAAGIPGLRLDPGAPGRASSARPDHLVPGPQGRRALHPGGERRPPQRPAGGRHGDGRTQGDLPAHRKTAPPLRPGRRSGRDPQLRQG